MNLVQIVKINWVKHLRISSSLRGILSSSHSLSPSDVMIDTDTRFKKIAVMAHHNHRLDNPPLKVSASPKTVARFSSSLYLRIIGVILSRSITLVALLARYEFPIVDQVSDGPQVNQHGWHSDTTHFATSAEFKIALLA